MGLQVSGIVSEDEKIRVMLRESEEYQQRLDMELLHSEQLNHIIKRDKLMILYMK